MHCKRKLYSTLFLFTFCLFFWRRQLKILVVGHTTKHMTHGRSLDMEIGRPSVLRPRVTFSTSDSSYFHVPLTTVRHLLNVAPVAGIIECQRIKRAHTETVAWLAGHKVLAAGACV